MFGRTTMTMPTDQSDDDSETVDIAAVLFGSLSMCTHLATGSQDTNGLPIICWRHTGLGAMCEACMVSHIASDKHTPPLPGTSDLPNNCTLCGNAIDISQQAQAMLVADRLGTHMMLLAHDVPTIFEPQADLMLAGGLDEPDALYNGPIKSVLNHWLCDRCRNDSPVQSTIVIVPVSPPPA
jgi:hypothetical protein